MLAAWYMAMLSLRLEMRAAEIAAWMMEAVDAHNQKRDMALQMMARLT